MPQTAERRKAYKNMSVEITKDFLEEINAYSKRKGKSKSDIIRAAIAEYIMNHQ